MSTKPKTSAPKPAPKSKALTSPAEAAALAQHAESATKTYGRGEKIRTKSIKDKKLRANLRSLEQKNQEAALQAKNAEILLENTAGMLEPEHELERTFKIRQDEIQREVGVETAKKGFELRLEGLGPYICEYTRNGRDLLLGGRKGHIACMDWRDGKLGCELHLNETVRDLKWLHNNQSFAVAQKNCVYIYARDGVELHQLKKHTEATHMEFLPYHFLLSSVSTTGVLRYTDTSTGQMLSEQPTRLGPPTAFAQNPHNAILHIGHQKGMVTLWSPNSSEPLVKMLPHAGPVRSIAVDRAGRYMVSTGQDRRMSIWDIRMFKEVHKHHLPTPGSTLSISDRNLVAVGWNTSLSIYGSDIFTRAAEDVKIPAPYMQWGGEGNTLSRVRFCPFEDVLGVSHDKGFSSILVPGSGEPNPDTLEAGLNPFENSKQRRETEVHALLDKLQPEMISLDPNFIGNLDLASEEQRRRERNLDAKKVDKIEELKKRGRGRNSALRRHLRKRGQRNVIDEEKMRTREAMKALEKKEVDRVKKQKVEYGPALERFARKRA
ncbi:BING4CT-domain-containing protein [Sporormia fimetaria CBS 119925]|uniref:U three protein 7 n=1 Tax=Sporormia fimetaria CBS 119925 TaxID=1340428 RepID=A0A6A6VGW1_9PLEO|nr:BING4CT-domain-containing protein [Sporormia fimetaria CBS 119925]